MSIFPYRPRSVRAWGIRQMRYKTGSNGGSFDKAPPCGSEGGPVVVKGISKRIIVVKSPDPRIFEQAIFIVREDYACQAGISQRELMRQARQAVGGFLPAGKQTSAGVVPWLRGLLYAAAGAAATALAWVMVQMAHIM